MKIEVERISNLKDQELQTGIDELLHKIRHTQFYSPAPKPIVIHVYDGRNHCAMKFTIHDQALLRTLREGLSDLGFWLDKNSGDKETGLHFRYPRTGAGVSLPAMGGGVWDTSNHVFEGIAGVEDKYSCLRLSEFIGLQHAETASLHHEIVSALETSIKLYPDTGLAELEEIIAERLTAVMPDAHINEVEVIRQSGSSLYRIRVRHRRGRFDAFFKIAEPADKAEAA